MRLLVVEDHPSLARSIANGLRDAGYAVDLTFDGAEALHLASVNPYDGLVLDLMLPNVDGWEIIRQVRQKKASLPVLCISARDGVNDRVKALDMGADDYLVKPFSWDEFMARVRSVVRRGMGQTSSVIKVGDLELDSARKIVRRAGKGIELSAREFTLLSYLAHRVGHVVSRNEIWDHVYDQYDHTASNVVDVYIGYLRRKIDEGHDQKLIHTRRGQGYMLSAEP